MNNNSEKVENQKNDETHNTKLNEKTSNENQNFKMNKKPNMKPDFKILKRVLGYVFKKYKITFAIVVVCLILSTVSSVAGNLYLQTLIDDYIIPLMQAENPVYESLLKAIFTMIGIYGMRSNNQSSTQCFDGKNFRGNIKTNS